MIRTSRAHGRSQDVAKHRLSQYSPFRRAKTTPESGLGKRQFLGGYQYYPHAAFYSLLLPDGPIIQPQKKIARKGRSSNRHPALALRAKTPLQLDTVSGPAQT